MDATVDTKCNGGDNALDTKETIVDSVVKNSFKVLSEDTITYLREKHVPEVMEFIMRTIIAQKPEAPFAFIHKLTSTPYLPRIVISGPPSTYVQTHCEQVQVFYKNKKNLRPVYISSGELIRDEIDNDTPAGQIAKSFVENQQLVPDCLVFSLVRNRLEKSDAKENGWVLEGFPRTAKQVHDLDAEGYSPDLYIQLVAADEVLEERVVWQRLDPVTDTLYHLKMNPPPSHDVALIERLIQRPEDTHESLMAHLKAYRQAAGVLAEHYASIRVCQNANVPLLEALKETDQTLEKHCIS
ncbi:unnamed protein product [Phytomonas sp. EM1]|nr:unnamed protein product [Phytomonas sp. EM1]|eukprot:CCW62955.1 unnamed protein product [Phytomonas sp. isolate EM1]